MIQITHTKPAPHTLGGTQFFGHDSRLYSVRADPGSSSEAPIEFHICSGRHRTMLDLSTEEAETLAACLATAIRLRREAEKQTAEQARKAQAMESNRVRTFFADPDGTLEAA